MAWSETGSWLDGQANERLYQRLLDDSMDAPSRNSRRKKIVRPEDMPWEMSRQGLLKHLINENMNTRMETVDAYMQIIPPGSRSGKHRHLAEECVYVIEGKGYDLHQDSDCEIGDVFEWTIDPEVKRFEWDFRLLRNRFRNCSISGELDFRKTIVLTFSASLKRSERDRIEISSVFNFNVLSW